MVSEGSRARTGQATRERSEWSGQPVDRAARPATFAATLKCHQPKGGHGLAAVPALHEFYEIRESLWAAKFLNSPIAGKSDPLSFSPVAIRLRVLHYDAKYEGRSAMTAKYRLTVNLDESEYEALQRIANGADRSLAWLGRRAICDFIEARERADAPLLAELANVGTSARQSAR